MMVQGWLRGVLCGVALVLPGAPTAAQACPSGLQVAGDVGIRALSCSGPAASCAINEQGPRPEPGGVRAAEAGDVGGGRQVRHVLAVEPVIMAVSAGSRLQVGDTLVAIDGLLITTAAGGARLARPPIGGNAMLLVRRGGRLREVRVPVRAGCGITSLKVSR